jgi:hypothetical protein
VLLTPWGPLQSTGTSKFNGLAFGHVPLTSYLDLREVR